MNITILSLLFVHRNTPLWAFSSEGSFWGSVEAFMCRKSLHRPCDNVRLIHAECQSWWLAGPFLTCQGCRLESSGAVFSVRDEQQIYLQQGCDCLVSPLVLPVGSVKNCLKCTCMVILISRHGSLQQYLSVMTQAARCVAFLLHCILLLASDDGQTA